MKSTCDISLKESLNAEEAVTYLGFGTRETLREWREQGYIAYYKLGKGRKITYSRQSLDKFLRTRLIPETA